MMYTLLDRSGRESGWKVILKISGEEEIADRNGMAYRKFTKRTKVDAEPGSGDIRSFKHHPPAQGLGTAGAEVQTGKPLVWSCLCSRRFASCGSLSEFILYMLYAGRLIPGIFDWEYREAGVGL